MYSFSVSKEKLDQVMLVVLSKLQTKDIDRVQSGQLIEYYVQKILMEKYALIPDHLLTFS